MKGIIHKLYFYRKKLGLIMVLVLAGCFVYAEGGPDAFFDSQVKVVKFYPNPATSYINFEFSNDVDKNYVLQIYSFVGKKMSELPVSSNKISLTLSNDFSRGIYLFRLVDKSGKVVETGKFQVIK